MFENQTAPSCLFCSEQVCRFLWLMLWRRDCHTEEHSNAATSRHFLRKDTPESKFEFSQRKFGVYLCVAKGKVATKKEKWHRNETPALRSLKIGQWLILIPTPKNLSCSPTTKVQAWYAFCTLTCAALIWDCLGPKCWCRRCLAAAIESQYG